MEPDYVNMPREELLNYMGVDGLVWAKAFLAITKDKALNLEEMFLWFANAISAGKDYRSWSVEENPCPHRVNGMCTQE